jgi:hypothetical protein
VDKWSIHVINMFALGYRWRQGRLGRPEHHLRRHGPPDFCPIDQSEATAIPRDIASSLANRRIIPAPAIAADLRKVAVPRDRSPRSGEDHAACAVFQERTVTFEWVGKSYNLTVARVRVDDEDLGATLIAVGAARSWLRH